MKPLKNDIKLEEKYKAWKEHCARPYSRYGNARRNNREINRKNHIAVTKESPLTSKIYELIPEEIKLKLNKIGGNSGRD